MESLKISSLDDLPAAADTVIGYLEKRPVVAFYGPMGAGKTTLIREICRQLDVQDNVTSPTFALVNQYLTVDGDHVNHFDFYRIDKVEEAFDFGYEEYFYSGDVCLIEWPEKIEGLLPEGVLKVVITTYSDKENSRTIVIDP